MSILAGFGIAISNDHNYSVDAGGQIQWFGGATHAVTWDAIKIWASEPSFAQEILSSIKIFGVNGFEVLQSCRASQSADAIIMNWINDWSFDLRRISSDRRIRNESSYNIDLKPSAYDQLKIEEVNLIIDASQAASPGLYDTHHSIDAAIIFSLCKSAQKATGKWGQAFWNNLISELQSNQGLSVSDAQDLVSIIRNSNTGHASNIIHNSRSSNKGFTGIFSRAMLMLKLATSINNSMWTSVVQVASGTGRDWQKHTLNEVGIASGIWDPLNPPAEYIDLDDDYALAVDDINKWLAGPTPFSQYAIWRDLGQKVHLISQFERIPIWIMAI